MNPSGAAVGQAKLSTIFAQAWLRLAAALQHPSAQHQGKGSVKLVMLLSPKALSVHAAFMEGSTEAGCC